MSTKETDIVVIEHDGYTFTILHQGHQTRVDVTEEILDSETDSHFKYVFIRSMNTSSGIWQYTFKWTSNVELHPEQFSAEHIEQTTRYETALKLLKSYGPVIHLTESPPLEIVGYFKYRIRKAMESVDAEFYKTLDNE